LTVEGSGAATPSFSELAANALRYWEPRRGIYNLVLTAVIAAHLVAGWPGTRALISTDHLLGAFFLAVLANIAYCAAYAVDLFVQFSGLRREWPRWRWTVLAVGCAFGAVITHFIMIAVTRSP
jgi:uncharacterized membrane protein